MWFATVPALARMRGRVAWWRSGIGKLLVCIGSGKAEHGPLLVPGQRQTRVRQQLVCVQITRLASVEDRFGDLRGEIAEADEPCEIGRAHPFPLGQSGNGTPSLSRSVALNRRALISSLTSRASGLAVANGSGPPINILISRPRRRRCTGTDRIWVSSSVAPSNCTVTTS